MFTLPQKTLLSSLIQNAQDALSIAIRGFVTSGGKPLEIQGPDIEVATLCGTGESMGPGSLTFAAEEKHLRSAIQNGANGIVTTPELLGGSQDTAFVLTKEPRLLFAAILNTVDKAARPAPPEGKPVFADFESVEIGDNVKFGPYSHIGRGVKIGARSVVGPYVFIEDEVEIGEDTYLHPRVTLRWRVKIGSRCQIHAGAVIGGDGFGYTQVPIPDSSRLLHYKNSHLGSVRIGDDVEIGSLSAVDRGLIEDTVIESGTKLDNLVQIGHNVKVGRDAIIVAQVGVGGHTKVGDRAFLLGQVGLSHGVVIGEDAILTGQAGVTGTVPPGRRAWGGSPARPMDEYLRDHGYVHRYLPLWRKFIDLFKKSRSFEDLKALFFEKPEKN